MKKSNKLYKLLNNVNDLTLSNNNLNKLSDEQNNIIRDLSKLSGKRFNIPRVKYDKFVNDLDGIDFLKLNNVSTPKSKTKTVVKKSKPKIKSKSKPKSTPKKSMFKIDVKKR